MADIYLRDNLSNVEIQLSHKPCSSGKEQARMYGAIFYSNHSYQVLTEQGIRLDNLAASTMR